MDLIGEFHPVSSKGNRYALTVICMLTGFNFCILLKSKKAEDVVTAYLNHICCVYGPSKMILTDNGTEFKNTDVGGSIHYTQDGTQSKTHLLTTVQQMHQRLPQVPQGMHWETNPKRS